MTTIRVPDETLDQEVGTGGGEVAFPPNPYRATIRRTRRKNLGERMTQAGATEPWAGYDSFDVEQIGIEFKPVTPLDDPTGEVAETIGQRPYFLDLTIRDGEHQLGNIDPSDNDVDYWQLQQSYTRVAQLAAAVGALRNGEIEDSFFDNLANGEFNGQEVILKITNRQGKNGKTYDNVARIDPA